MATQNKDYDRAQFVSDWATKILKCESNESAVAAELINQFRNFQTAVAIAFGLSFTTHKEYALAAAEHWKKNFDEGSKATAEYVTQFRDYYINEVVAYPADA